MSLIMNFELRALLQPSDKKRIRFISCETESSFKIESFSNSEKYFQIMSDVYEPPERVAAESHCRGMNKYNEMYNESLDDPKKFWSRICQQFYWKTPIPEGTLMDLNI